MDMATQDAHGAPIDAHLYVSKVSPRATEFLLTEVFTVGGDVQYVKIIPDRYFQHEGLNYALVKYFDIKSAQKAIEILNGREMFGTAIQVNWVSQIQENTADAAGGYRVFVGGLSKEVNDDVLLKAFSAFSSLSAARVKIDLNSGKHLGNGLLTFSNKTDAEQAIASMNGEWLGSSAVTLRWANQKPQEGPYSSVGQTLESIMLQAPSDQTTLYLGNLVPYTTQADLIPLFQGFGCIVNIEVQANDGIASVTVDTHEHAAMAIINLIGTPVHGRPLSCGWKTSDLLATGSQQFCGTNAAPASQPQESSELSSIDPIARDHFQYYTQYQGYGLH